MAPVHYGAGMSRDYTQGFYTVTSWNDRALRCQADDRVIYRGADPIEAVRIFEGLTRWKRHGLVQMTNPIGLVSIAVRGSKHVADWTTHYAHPEAP